VCLMAATPRPAFFTTLKVCATEDRRRLALLVSGVSQLLSAMEELVLRLGRPIIDRRSAPLLTQLAPGEWGETFAAARRATTQMKAIPAPHRTNTPNNRVCKAKIKTLAQRLDLWLWKTRAVSIDAFENRAGARACGAASCGRALPRPAGRRPNPIAQRVTVDTVVFTRVPAQHAAFHRPCCTWTVRISDPYP
jgi:hypothetical protein